MSLALAERMASLYCDRAMWMDVSAALRDWRDSVASERDEVDAASAAAKGVEDVSDMVGKVLVASVV
jgi:hypothetical protein